jgi:hypothetical protein
MGVRDLKQEFHTLDVLILCSRIKIDARWERSPKAGQRTSKGEAQWDECIPRRRKIFIVMLEES